MGMHDYVNFEMKCPNCGTMLRDWQTKDGKCLLEVVEIDTIDEFYTSCQKCRTWYSFSRKKPRPKGKPLSKKEIAIVLKKFILIKSRLPPITGAEEGEVNA